MTTVKQVLARARVTAAVSSLVALVLGIACAYVWYSGRPWWPYVLFWALPAAVMAGYNVRNYLRLSDLYHIEEFR